MQHEPPRPGEAGTERTMPTGTLQDVQRPPAGGPGGAARRRRRRAATAAPGSSWPIPRGSASGCSWAPLSMMFIGFTSAYMVRPRLAGLAAACRAIPLLWVNTAALLASSVTLEAARRKLRGCDLRGRRAVAAATGILGLVFVGGQVLAWRTLAAPRLLPGHQPPQLVLLPAHAASTWCTSWRRSSGSRPPRAAAPDGLRPGRGRPGPLRHLLALPGRALGLSAAVAVPVF